MIRVLFVACVAVGALSACTTSTRGAADAFYGSLFPSSAAPAAAPR